MPPGRTALVCGLAVLLLHGCGGGGSDTVEPGVGPGTADAPSAGRPSGTRITKRRLGPGVNTPYTELLPIALASGDTLYFTRAEYPDPTLRTLVEAMFKERLGACRGLDPGVLAEAATRAGAELTERDKDTLAAIAPDCGELERVRDRELYNFDRAPHPNQVYVSRRQDDGTWSMGERLPAPLNDDSLANIGNVAITSASPDRRTLLLMGDLLFGQQRVDGCLDLATSLGVGNVECLPIAIARQTGEAWVREDRLRTEPFATRLLVSGAALAPDGRTVVLSARDRNTRIDNHDRLFVTAWNEVTRLWSAPREIPGLSGPFDTGTPFVGPDARSLYFASNRPGGQGGFDLYLTRRQGEGWLDWSAPENLGSEVNTAQNDVSMSVDATGRYAFMASGVDAQLDIYEFDLPPNLSPAPTAIVGGRILLGSGLGGKATSEGVGGEGEPLILRGGGGLGGGNMGGAAPQSDEETVVFVRLSDAGVAGQAAFDGATGTFVTRLPVGDRYAAYVSAPGFAGIGQIVDLTSASADQRVDHNLSVTRLEPGAVIRLENVFFDTDSAELLPESRAELDRLVLILRRYPAMRIEIAGHTDARSSEAYNEGLSSRRAASVQEYLEAAGVASGRLQSQGYGEGRPVASNDTEEGRQLNRRVEFRVLSMD